MTDQTTAGRSAWAENILYAIMPIILANAPQGIGDRDYETMVKTIMARLPDEQKPGPGKLSIHVTVDDLMPAIKSTLAKMVAVNIPDSVTNAMELAIDWIASAISQPHNIDTRMIDDGRHILQLLTDAHNEGVK